MNKISIPTRIYRSERLFLSDITVKSDVSYKNVDFIGNFSHFLK